MELSNDRLDWDHIFISMLDKLAKRSLCIKIHTAAFIVSNQQILAIGYNGTFSKCDECITYWKQYHQSNNIDVPFDKWIKSDDFKTKHREWSKKEEIHAEANALTWISKRKVTKDYILYTKYSPCDACAKSIISYGIKNVYYEILYHRGKNAINRMIQHGITCRQIVNL